MSFLRLRGLEKRFPNGTVAVEHLDLELAEGELVALLGPSGCGKTTTLRCIAGFEDPTAGTIELAGRRIDSLPPNRRGATMVFQGYALFPHLSVFENVAYGLRVRGMRGESLRTRVGEALALVGLGGLGERKPQQLSGGQQQRVALARALILEPKLLLFDEPLSNLDAKLREQMRLEIRSLQQRVGITSVYVTHDQVEAMTLSDRIAVMNAGRIVQLGSPREIYYEPRSTFIADFVGAVNLIPATVREVRERMAVLAFGDTRVTVRVPDGVAVRDGAHVQLCVRPEALWLAASPTVASAGTVPLSGTVKRSAFLGDVMRYWIDVAGREWIVDQPDPGAGSTFTSDVAIVLRPERAHIIAEG